MIYLSVCCLSGRWGALHLLLWRIISDPILFIDGFAWIRTRGMMFGRGSGTHLDQWTIMLVFDFRNPRLALLRHFCFFLECKTLPFIDHFDHAKKVIMRKQTKLVTEREQKMNLFGKWMLNLQTIRRLYRSPFSLPCIFFVAFLLPVLRKSKIFSPRRLAFFLLHPLHSLSFYSG